MTVIVLVEGMRKSLKSAIARRAAYQIRHNGIPGTYAPPDDASTVLLAEWHDNGAKTPARVRLEHTQQAYELDEVIATRRPDIVIMDGHPFVSNWVHRCRHNEHPQKLWETVTRPDAALILTCSPYTARQRFTTALNESDEIQRETLAQQYDAYIHMGVSAAGTTRIYHHDTTPNSASLTVSALLIQIIGKELERSK